MFSIGIAEPLPVASRELVRHSIVWVGEPRGENSQGLSADHPICGALVRILQRAGFIGTWVVCQEVSGMRDFERKSLLLRLKHAKWTIDPESAQLVRAQKNVSLNSFWPYGSNPALPWPQHEILIAGCLANYDAMNCADERHWRSQYAVRGDGLVLRSELAHQLAVQQGYAISVGRAQTNNSPGLSIIGPDGWLDPEVLVERSEVIGVHKGANAALAWSYG